MKSLFFVALAATMLSVGAQASVNSQTIAGVSRISRLCPGQFNANKIYANVNQAQPVSTNGVALEAFLSYSGRVTIVNPNTCSGVRYNFGGGVRKILTVNGRLYMISKFGGVYFMNGYEQVYELTNAQRRPYTTIIDVEKRGSTAFLIQRGGNAVPLDEYSFQKKIATHHFIAIQPAQRGGWYNLFN